MVRHTVDSGGAEVLSIKCYDTQDEAGGYKYKHYKVNTDGGMVYFTEKNKFKELKELIEFCQENKEDRMEWDKITNICLIPNPHSDPGFKYSMQNDSRRVPISEIELVNEIGGGQFVTVRKAIFRGFMTVAVKQLQLENEEEGAKALDKFFSQTNTLKELNHPNLVQIFAHIVDKSAGIFLIQEFMAEGDLKSYLKRWKEQPVKMAKDTQIWSKLLSWQIDVASGMIRLESLNIAHRNLAARWTRRKS